MKNYYFSFFFSSAVKKPLIIVKNFSVLVLLENKFCTKISAPLCYILDIAQYQI